MSNGPREGIKRRLEQSITHIETIQVYLIQNGEIYFTDHPEITEQYKAVYSFAEELKNLLEGLRYTY